jgi:cell wall-associated NlpC family hydrolase
VAGGVGSVIAGGKFANGAETAAFGYLFNYLQHGRDITPREGARISDNAATWKDTPYATAGTELAGAAAMQGVGADCSGSTCKIYDQVGNVYSYRSSGQFAGAAATEGFPFRQLTTNESFQQGDVILFKGHMAIYAGQDGNGNSLMWTARGAGRPYTQMPMKYWGSQPIGYYRYQVPR